MLHKLMLYYSSFPTVRYATLSIVLISLCAALLGVFLVLKRYSMIGDGLAHVSFGTMSVATVLGLTTPIYVTLPLTVIASVLILRFHSKRRVQGDAATAMISAGALAFGYVLLNLFLPENGTASADACATLFGSGILGIDGGDLGACLVLSAIVLFLFIFFYNRLFTVTFDEDFATATGTRAGSLQLLIAIVTGVTVVVAMNLLGALLVSALITFPALSAMRLFKTFRRVTVCVAILSASCAIVGILVSLCAATPIGPTVVATDLAVFIACYIIGVCREQ